VKDRGLPQVAADKQDWHSAAACRHADWELFFPEGTAGPALRQAGQAKRICMACPVRVECLTWALRHGVEFGIWGGTSPEQRRALRAAPARRVPPMRTRPDLPADGHHPALPDSRASRPRTFDQPACWAATSPARVPPRVPMAAVVMGW
jgi:WhiB family transcriptional regulator, redox-sensing transcriptional regulator